MVERWSQGRRDRETRPGERLDDDNQPPQHFGGLCIAHGGSLGRLYCPENLGEMIRPRCCCIKRVS